MTEVKGVTWDLAGEQISYGWALALCYDAGWRRKDLNTAVAVMSAESQRYVQAYHHNHEHDADGNNVHDNEFGNIITLSTDWGLFQINDKWHPAFELPADLNPIYNVAFAHEMWRANGKSFNAWAVTESGAFLKYLVTVWFHRKLGRWKAKVPNVEKRFG